MFNFLDCSRYEKNEDTTNFHICRCERLQINDRIISINDMPLSGISIDPQPLHKVPGTPLGSVIMLVEYDLYDTVVSVTDNILAVELMKCNRKNLGITMTGKMINRKIRN